jgi:ribosomal protein S18 acetylase RimI-like enzyme
MHEEAGDFWYVNRVSVPEKYRRQGIGTKLMKAVQKKIELPMIVEPGGYGIPPEETAKWYRKQGFEDVTEAECLTLKWVPRSEEKDD